MEWTDERQERAKRLSIPNSFFGDAVAEIDRQRERIVELEAKLKAENQWIKDRLPIELRLEERIAELEENLEGCKNWIKRMSGAPDDQVSSFIRTACVAFLTSDPAGNEALPPGDPLKRIAEIERELAQAKEEIFGFHKRHGYDYIEGQRDEARAELAKHKVEGGIRMGCGHPIQCAYAGDDGGACAVCDLKDELKSLEDDFLKLGRQSHDIEAERDVAQKKKAELEAEISKIKQAKDRGDFRWHEARVEKLKAERDALREALGKLLKVMPRYLEGSATYLAVAGAEKLLEGKD